MNAESKVCNYCIDCNFIYAIDKQYCPKCKGKLFPIPYSKLDDKNESRRV